MATIYGLRLSKGGCNKYTSVLPHKKDVDLLNQDKEIEAEDELYSDDSDDDSEDEFLESLRSEGLNYVAPGE